MVLFCTARERLATVATTDTEWPECLAESRQASLEKQQQLETNVAALAGRIEDDQVTIMLSLFPAQRPTNLPALLWMVAVHAPISPIIWH